MNSDTPILANGMKVSCLMLLLVPSLRSSAQATCADLSILSVQYAAFNDSVIEVVAQASAGSFFSYPQFSLIDTDNDTLTHEEVNFFGIGQSPQTHSSILRAGQTLPTSPFEGSLLFRYSGPGEESFCTFPLSGSLCPPEPCIEMEVFVYRQAVPTLVTTAFNWAVSNEEGSTVGSGILEIDAAAGQVALADLCLPPGNYLLHAEQEEAVGDDLNVGVGQRNFIVTGPMSTLPAGGEIDLPFTLQAQRIATGNGITETRSTGPLLLLDARVLTISSREGLPLGSIEILDATGRCVRRRTTTSSLATMELADLACGMHFVRTVPISRISRTQRIILD